MCLHAGEHVSEIFAERGEAGFSAECLVVSEEAEHDVGFDLGEPLIGVTEVGRAWASLHLVAGEAEVSDGESMSGKFGLDVGFEPAVVLHAIGKVVADDGDVVVGVECQEVGCVGDVGEGVVRGE